MFTLKSQYQKLNEKDKKSECLKLQLIGNSISAELKYYRGVINVKELEYSQEIEYFIRKYIFDFINRKYPADDIKKKKLKDLKVNISVVLFFLWFILNTCINNYWF